MNYNDYNTFIKRKVEMNMRLVVQRVSEASVEIEGKINGQIKQGFMVLYENRDAAQIGGIPVFFMRF